MKCPKCGNDMRESDDRHYYYCVKFGNRGCDTLWAKSPDCYFNGLYIIDELGIKAYKQTAQEGGKIIKTDHILSKYNPRELPT